MSVYDVGSPEMTYSPQTGWMRQTGRVRNFQEESQPLNETLFEELSSQDPIMGKKAIDAINDFTRIKLRKAIVCEAGVRVKHKHMYAYGLMVNKEGYLAQVRWDDPGMDSVLDVDLIEETRV